MLDLYNKDLSHMINTVKAWVWNCQNDDSVLVIYGNPSEKQRESREYRAIMNIINGKDLKIFDKGLVNGK